jgi:hypothetical protein
VILKLDYERGNMRGKISTGRSEREDHARKDLKKGLLKEKIMRREI